MSGLLNDPIFFYAVAYVLFLLVAWVFVRKPGLEWIDGEINKIRDELEEARSLRLEAEAALANAKAKKFAALAEADSIVKHAKDEASRLQQEAAANLKSLLARHEQHALERIALSEHEALAKVRTVAVDMAMSLVRKTLAERLDDASATKLSDEAIAAMPELPAAKARAA
ncbi:MAG: F0F1 ATP synthase subunit B [Pseudomonadota bacterium]|nr:F0F1 ATP synthase subunit B [Pseudomonadota bacterium]